MNKCLLLALALPLIGCTVGTSGNPGTGTDAGGNPGTDGGGGSGSSGLSGTITADTTWSGTTTLLGQVTINAGVTVTVAPGATVKSASDTQITLKGTLLEQGAKATPVTFQNVAISVASGGTLTATYANHTGGGIETTTGATVTITDSTLSHAQGDFLVMSGGNVTLDYSQIGVGAPMDAARGSDTTHCDMHFNSAESVKINHSNIASSAYGIMLYANNADLSLNNWYSNTMDFEPYTVTGGKADGSWFKAANGSTTYVPTGVQGVTFNNLSATPLPNGPR